MYRCLNGSRWRRSTSHSLMSLFHPPTCLPLYVPLLPCLLLSSSEFPFFMCNCVTVRAERGDVPWRCEWLWHPWDLRRRLEPGKENESYRNPKWLWSSIRVYCKPQTTFFLLQCPHNVHKLDGYMCDAGQVKSSDLRNVPVIVVFDSITNLCLSSFHVGDIMATILLFRVVVMEAAVRPETDSAGPCGATVGLDWMLSLFLDVVWPSSGCSRKCMAVSSDGI